MASIETLGSNTYRIVGAAGTKAGEHRFKIVDDAVISVYDGHCLGEFFEPANQVLEKLIARRGKVVLFNDTTKITGYDAAYREKWTHWFLGHRSQVEMLHILVRSGILKMAVSLVSLAVSGLIKGHSDPASFRKALGPLEREYQKLLQTTVPTSVAR
jgi:hypothetical protein